MTVLAGRYQLQALVLLCPGEQVWRGLDLVQQASVLVRLALGDEGGADRRWQGPGRMSAATNALIAHGQTQDGWLFRVFAIPSVAIVFGHDADAQHRSVDAWLLASQMGSAVCAGIVGERASMCALQLGNLAIRARALGLDVLDEPAVLSALCRELPDRPSPAQLVVASRRLAARLDAARTVWVLHLAQLRRRCEYTVLQLTARLLQAVGSRSRLAVAGATRGHILAQLGANATELPPLPVIWIAGGPSDGPMPAASAAYLLGEEAELEAWHATAQRLDGLDACAGHPTFNEPAATASDACGPDDEGAAAGPSTLQWGPRHARTISAKEAR